MAVAGQVKQEFFKDGYRVEIERDPETRIVTYEAWSKDGKLDRDDGPAVILRDPATGTITFEARYRCGKLDCADGPAYIERSPAGVVIAEEWWTTGERVNLRLIAEGVFPVDD